MRSSQRQLTQSCARRESLPPSLSVWAHSCSSAATPTTHKADKKIQTALQAAIDYRSIGDAESDAAAQKKLDEAAQDQNGSPATRRSLRPCAGNWRSIRLESSMRRIDHSELELSRVAFDLGQLAVQLDAGSVMVSGFGKYDPAPVQKTIAQQIADAQGSPDKPTWEFQSLQMPTIDATNQTIAKLQGELAKLTEQVQTLTTHAQAVLKDAEAAAKSADEKKGREAVDEFKRATMLRKTQASCSRRSKRPTRRWFRSNAIWRLRRDSLRC